VFAITDATRFRAYTPDAPRAPPSPFGVGRTTPVAEKATMSETNILGNGSGGRRQGVPAEERLRLLARWLLRCHERTRQRRQLGVLEPRLYDDIGVIRSDVLAETEKPFWR
jgi:uncharacterized protein YjiS (DUF1127 family)